MKVYIGPYKDWIGPYQIANWLQKIGISEDRCDLIGEYLTKTWLMKFCEWVDSKKKRNIKIKIDDYDIWGMDHTLALIILPMLKKLQKDKHGAPNVDDDDVPDGLNLRSTEAPPKENEWDTDQNHFKRWDWVMDELIWTFEQLSNEDDEDQFYDHSECDYSKGVLFSTENSKKIKVDHEGLKKHQDRIKNGLRLFGKYYQSLWD